MTPFIYFAFIAAILHASAGNLPRCSGEDGQCSFEAACFDTTDEGTCKSYDIEMKDGDCATFSGDEKYANHYLRLKLLNGFIEQSKITIDSKIYSEETRHSSMRFYVADAVDGDEIARITTKFSYVTDENDKAYERLPEDSNLMIPIGWDGVPVNIKDIEEPVESEITLENHGNVLQAKIDNFNLEDVSAPDSSMLSRPLVLHLKNQIFPTKICYHVPQAALLSNSVDENDEESVEDNGKLGCHGENGECDFEAECFTNKTNEGLCRSYDAEMWTGACISFNGSETYAADYVRLRLMNGLPEGSSVSLQTKCRYQEGIRHAFYFQAQRQNIEIHTIGYYMYVKEDDDGTPLAITTVWDGKPVIRTIDDFIDNSVEVKNTEGAIQIKAGIDPFVLVSKREHYLRLDEPLILHLTKQILASKVCYHVPSVNATTKVNDEEPTNAEEEENEEELPRKEDNEDNNNADGVENKQTLAESCIIFNRSLAAREVPLYTRLNRGFERGKMLSIRGLLKKGAKKVVLDILTKNHTVAFHLKVELDKNRIVLSDKVGERWRRHSDSKNLFFKASEAFQLDLYRVDETVLIFVNESMMARFRLNESTPELSTAYFHILHDVIIETVCYKSENPTSPSKVSSASLLEKDCMNKWADLKQYKIPLMRLPMELSLGRSLRINMTAYMFEDRLGINLLDKDEKRVLHLSFRKNTRQMVITVGGKSKRVRVMPFSTGRNYEIRISNKGDYFEIFTDGEHWQSSKSAKFQNPDYLIIYGNGLISGLCLAQD